MLTPESIPQIAIGGSMATFFGWLVLQLVKQYMGIIKQKDKDIERLERKLESRDKRVNRKLNEITKKVDNGKEPQ